LTALLWLTARVNRTALRATGEPCCTYYRAVYVWWMVQTRGRYNPITSFHTIYYCSARKHPVLFCFLMITYFPWSRCW